MFLFKNVKFKKNNKKLSIEEMVELENALAKKRETSLIDINDCDKLAKSLRLKVEYVETLDKNVEAVLRPIDDEYYLGHILVKNLPEKREKFAYMHEIIHYVFDVGVGEKVDKIYTRKEKGKTDCHEEQRINYLTAACIMDYNEVLKEIKRYDDSEPKMDEIKFVRDLQKKYEQSENGVIRRIREIRILEKARKKGLID